ncbi:MAG: glycosyltransferase family 39 protein [Pirellulales bacterium]|nr:glycosyltransferase family 39 protein [Pirellulales bacterium]
MNSPASHPWPPLRLCAALGLAMACGCALRWRDVTHSLWLDELHTSWTVWGDLAQVASRAEQGNQPPLYSWLVWLVMQAGGRSELGLRLVSLVAGSLLVPATGWVAWRWTGSASAALVAGLYVAGDRYSIFYAQDARPYACVQCVALAQLVVFDRVLATGSRAVRLVAVALASVNYWLHYTAVLPTVGLWLYAAWLARDPAAARRYGIVKLAQDIAVTLMLMAPSIGALQAIAGHRELWQQFVPALTPANFAFQLLTLFPVLPVVVLPWASMLPVVRRAPAEDPTRVRLLWCWLLAPLLLTAIATLGDFARLFLPRYLVGVAVVPGLLAAWVAARVGRGAQTPAQRTWLPVVVTVLTLWYPWLGTRGSLRAALAAPQASPHAREDWRAAAAWARRFAGPAAVVVNSGLIEAALPPSAAQDDYLLLPVNNLYDLRSPQRLLLPGRGDDLHAVARELTGRHPFPGPILVLQRGSLARALAAAHRLIESLDRTGMKYTIADSAAWPGAPGVAAVALQPAR